MASPNTKIIIQEVDETSPKGSGVSSDVAYIPGLAVDSYNIGTKDAPEYKDTVKNVPVLCYTVSDFEAAFGPDPYVFTQEDVSGAASQEIASTLEVGGFDRSYIYAKELLQAGLPIYYENIAPEGNVVTNVIGINAANISSTGGTVTEDDDLKIMGANNYKYIACEDRKNTSDTYSFKFSPYYNALPTAATAKTSTENTTSAGSIFIKVIPEVSVDKLTVMLTETHTWNSESEKFRIESVGNPVEGWIVTWAGTTAEDLKAAEITVQTTFTYAGKKYGVEYPFSIAIVAGRELNGQVVNGRISYFYNNLQDALLKLEDKNEYTIKYLTSGGFPTYDIGDKFTLYATMLSVAGNRGDAVALIDHLDRPEAPHGVTDTAAGSIFNKVNTDLANIDNSEYGAMFTPWAKYAFATVTDNPDAPAFMPASFGYLMCMASAIATSPNWLAMAGVTRGMVPNLQSLHTDTILSNVVAEDYQPKYGTGKNVSVNCITNVKPYGLCIWGNRTLQPMDPKGAVALNFLNTRNMVSDIKKLAYSTAKKLMFEQDSDTLWLRFKSGISPLLDQLVSGYGISGYKIIRGTTKYNGQALTRGEMAAVIKIFPIAPIEYFEITVVLADEDVQVG